MPYKLLIVLHQQQSSIAPCVSGVVYFLFNWLTVTTLSFLPNSASPSLKIFAQHELNKCHFEPRDAVLRWLISSFYSLSLSNFGHIVIIPYSIALDFTTNVAVTHHQSLPNLPIAAILALVGSRLRCCIDL